MNTIACDFYDRPTAQHSQPKEGGGAQVAAQHSPTARTAFGSDSWAPCGEYDWNDIVDTCPGVEVSQCTS